MPIRYSLHRILPTKLSTIVFAIFLSMFSSWPISAGDDIRVEGPIQAISGYSLVVSGSIFFVNSETEIRGPNGDMLFSDLNVGLVVEIRANYDADNRFVAERIELDDNIRIEGLIQTINPDSSGVNSLMVNDVIIQVDNSTEIRGEHGTALPFSDLQPGDFVEVRADLQNNNGYLATRIDLEKNQDDDQNEIEVRGIIENLGQDSLVVTGLAFFVNGNTEFRDDLGNRLTFNDFQVGDPVEVRAIRRPDSTLLATRVKLRNNQQDEIEFTAPIDTIFNSSLVVGGITFDTNENTEILNDNNLPISFSDLSVGLIVEIKALRQPDSSFLAVRIKIEDAPGFSSITGAVTSLSPNSIFVAEPEFLVTQNTVVLDKHFQLISYSEISTGDEVILWSNAGDGSLPVALQIRITRAGNLTGISNEEEIENIPAQFGLAQNYPNPFNPSTTIPFTIEGSDFHKIELVIFNILGQQVRTLFNGLLDSGTYEFVWGAVNDQGFQLPSGIYFYQLRVNNNVVASKRMMLMK